MFQYWFNGKTGKKIYIYGDDHVIDPTCPNNTKPDIDITDFIEKTIKVNKDQQIDLFVETSFKTEDYYEDKI